MTGERLVNCGEIARTLTLFRNPDSSATEISAFKVELDDFVRGISGKSLKTVAGYWTTLDAAAETIRAFLLWTQKSRSPEAFYFLLNPANPALAARSYNEWDARAERRAGDADIIVLRYLLIDLDACRPAGISSTEAEHAATLDRAARIADFLVELGWATPVLADSGNGGHLIVRLDDLPNVPSNSSLLQKTLHTLDQLFSDVHVKVDVTTFNPARICKLYGTIVRKGSDTEDRPYRLAHLVSVPDGYHDNRATAAQLQAFVDRFLVEQAPSEEKTARSKNTGTALDIEKLLQDNNLQYAKRAWSSGWKYILPECLFNPNHVGTSAAILQFPSGAVDYRCLHNGCANKTWHDARDVLQPSWRTHPRNSDPDLSKQKSDIANALTISVTHRRIRDMTADALRALKAANAVSLRFFQQGNVLVRLRADDEGTPIIEALSVDSLLGELDRAADWIRTTEDAVFPADPPTKVVRDVLALPAYDLGRLKAVATAPFFDRRGELILNPGYDPNSEVFLHLQNSLEIPPVPTAPPAFDVELARDRLLSDLLGDFPFDADSSKAYAIGALLYPFALEIIDAQAPLHAFDAPTPGSGKGLLGDVISIVTYGRKLGVGAESKDIDEIRKRITSLLLNGMPIALLDNVRGRLDNSALAAAITADPWQDRILGKNKLATLRNHTLWFLTANQLRASDEMARRLVRIRLEPDCEHPEERTDFRHSDLRSWTREQRGELIHAALVLIQNWIAKGRPLFTKRTLGSFERWAQVIGGILESAGIPGFLEDRQKVRRDTDSASAAWRAFVEGWFVTFALEPTRVGDLVPFAEENLGGLFKSSDTDRAKETRLGFILRQQRGRVFGEYRIVQTEKEDEQKRRKPAWRLEPAKPGNKVGEVGETPNSAEKPSETKLNSSPTSGSGDHAPTAKVGGQKAQQNPTQFDEDMMSPTSPYLDRMGSVEIAWKRRIPVSPLPGPAARGFSFAGKFASCDKLPPLDFEDLEE